MLEPKRSPVLQRQGLALDSASFAEDNRRSPRPCFVPIRAALAAELFLNHGIAAGRGTSQGRNPFLGGYVFPDGELVPIHTALGIAESAGFEVRDLESLREHYVLTLDRWRSRFESQQEKARRFVDETTFRTWRLYLAGCAHAFSTRRLNLYQVLFSSNSDSGWSGLPLTRNDWYSGATQHSSVSRPY